VPFEGLADYLGDNRVEENDPVVVGIHLAWPGACATDRGKSRYALPGDIKVAMRELVSKVTDDWRKLKFKQAREGERLDRDATARARGRNLDEKLSKKQRVKDAAFQVMPQAYAEACIGGSANARQIMYAARRLVIALTGIAEPWKD